VTAETPQISGACEHAVHFYATERQLAAVVCDYLIGGVRAGAVNVVIATESHRSAFEAGMARAGIDLKGLHRDAYVPLDAAATMARFMPEGRIDPAAFRAVMGDVLRRAGRAGRPVQAYGEMVAMLWEAGDVLGAIALEELWNELCDELGFLLLCAYKSESVTADPHRDAFAQVCRLHTSVLGASEARFAPKRDAPSAARGFIARWLAERGHDHERLLVDDARLVISELATNAVIHARTPFVVSARSGVESIHISVTDGSRAQPVIQHAEPTALSGRGLQLVEAIAGSWGVETRSDGKTVWADLSVRRSV
jgi:anti-sigma regulatory factor (Ser/Thr protein kinase)